MSKIAVLADTHFGVRRGSQIFHSILMDKFNWFIDTVTKKDTYDSIVMLGDIFDSRSHIDLVILNDFISAFTKLCDLFGKNIYVIAGNHDQYFRDVTKETTNILFLENFKNVKVVFEPEVIDDHLFIPWIDNEEKKNKVKELLKKEPEYVFGHFDLLQLFPSKEDTPEKLNALSDSDFSDKTLAYVGHYHRKMKHKNINYCGSFINTSFSDISDSKGFWEIDTEAKTEKFIPNNCPEFYYMTIENPVQFIKAFELSSQEMKDSFKKKIEGNFIKLFLNEYKKENDDIRKLVRGFNPLEISVAFNKMSFEEDVTNSFTGFDTKTDIVTVLNKYLDSVKAKIPETIGVDGIKELIEKKNKLFKHTVIS